MCYAILRVSYRNDKQVTVHECDSQADMDRKIVDKRATDQVARIGVFLCHRHIERTEQWVETPYSPPKQDEINV